MNVTIRPQALVVSFDAFKLSAGFKNPIARDIGDIPVYEGDYVVIPQADSAVVLETQAKLMTEDVTVTKIPYWETSNLSGGNTVFIASEV